MTKKDYVAIAAVLAASLDSTMGLSPIGDSAGVREVINRMASMLARDNPRFDRNRFLAACAAKVKE